MRGDRGDTSNLKNVDCGLEEAKQEGFSKRHRKHDQRRDEKARALQRRFDNE